MSHAGCVLATRWSRTPPWPLPAGTAGPAERGGSKTGEVDGEAEESKRRRERERGSAQEKGEETRNAGHRLDVVHYFSGERIRNE